MLVVAFAGDGPPLPFEDSGVFRSIAAGAGAVLGGGDANFATAASGADAGAVLGGDDVNSSTAVSGAEAGAVLGGGDANFATAASGVEAGAVLGGGDANVVTAAFVGGEAGGGGEILAFGDTDFAAVALGAGGGCGHCDAMANFKAFALFNTDATRSKGDGFGVGAATGFGHAGREGLALQGVGAGSTSSGVFRFDPASNAFAAPKILFRSRFGLVGDCAGSGAGAFLGLDMILQGTCIIYIGGATYLGAFSLA